MNDQEHFDHIIGKQDSGNGKSEINILKRIIRSHSEEYSEQERMNFQRVGLHLRMQRYLSSPVEKIIHVGEFLNELLSIYQVKKVKFAELIEYENTNLHAVLRGRRRLNNKLATKIGFIFSINPELWMFIDAKNQLTQFQRENKLSKAKYSLKNLKQAK